MLNTAPSKLDRGAAPEASLAGRFIGMWNFPALDYISIRALFAIVLSGICLIRAYVGLWGSRIYTQDAFSVLDGAWRVMNGQRPHIDFYTGLGPVTYLITAAGVVLASGNAAGLAYGQAIFGCVVGLWGYLLCERRLRGLATILACFLMVLMAIVPTTIGGPPTEITPATTYNRGAYALAALLMIEAVAPSHKLGRRREFWGGISTGLLLGILLFFKISFFMGAGFLLVALLPCRHQEKDRWYGIAAAFALCMFAFAWYLRFDLAAVYNDLRTVAQTKHVMVGSYLAKDLGVTACPFLLFVYLLSQGAPSRANRRAMRIAGISVCLAGFFFLLTSWQFFGLPLDALMAILLIDRVTPDSANALRDFALRPLVLLLGCFLAVTYLTPEAVALNFALSQKLEAKSHFDFTAPVLAGFNSTTERDYVEYINEGFALLNQHRQPQDTVLSLNFTNPFSFGLGMKPPAGGTTWLQYGNDFDEIHGPSAERVFGDASLVMLPKIFSDGTLPDTLPRIYGPFLKQHYALLAESLNWWLYRRKDGQDRLAVRGPDKAAVSSSR